MKYRLLLADAVTNLVLGILLLWFPPWLVSALGVPAPDSDFYPNMLGAVLFGIGLALLVEWQRRPPSSTAGLGLTGAIAINLSGGTVLAAWLLFGDLGIPTRGVVFLWGLAVLLVGLSSLELYHLRPTDTRPRERGDTR